MGRQVKVAREVQTAWRPKQCSVRHHKTDQAFSFFFPTYMCVYVEKAEKTWIHVHVATRIEFDINLCKVFVYVEFTKNKLFLPFV